MAKALKGTTGRKSKPPGKSPNVGDRGRVLEVGRGVPNRSARALAGLDGAFPIVGVGASAGGLEAFTRLVQHLPADTGMAFVLVQHLDPEHESRLPQLLGRAAKLPVLEVVNNTQVKPNCV